MSGLPHGNARQHDSVPNWLAGFFEDVAFSDGSAARAGSEADNALTLKLDPSLGADQGRAPRYIVRDRDRVYGEIFKRRLRAMGIRDRPTAPRLRNGHAERLSGSIRRECPEHVVIFSELHLRHVLLSYMEYYNGARTHLSLNKDTPTPRAVQAVERILTTPILGGLHHHYVHHYVRI